MSLKSKYYAEKKPREKREAEQSTSKYHRRTDHTTGCPQPIQEELDEGELFRLLWYKPESKERQYNHAQSWNELQKIVGHLPHTRCSECMVFRYGLKMTDICQNCGYPHMLITRWFAKEGTDNQEGVLRWIKVDKFRNEIDDE